VHHSIITDLQLGSDADRRRLAVYCLKVRGVAVANQRSFAALWRCVVALLSVNVSGCGSALLGMGTGYGTPCVTGETVRTCCLFLLKHFLCGLPLQLFLLLF
jgi:hypothetical protein